MSWFEDNIVDPVVDPIQNFIDDPSLSSFGNMLAGFTYGALNIATGGALAYANDALQDYIAGLVPEQEFKDRKRTVRSAVQAREVIYGKVRTGGHMVYVEDAGKDKTLLWMCIVVAGHEVEEIEAVRFNDEVVATSNGPGVNGLMNRQNGTSFDDNFLVWSIHGNRSSAFIPSANIDYDDDSYDVTGATPPNWTTSHRLAFQSYIWINLVYEKDVFQDSGIPTVTVDVKGKNDLYDPRDGSFSYTDNQALVALDLLRWDRFFNADDSEIDMDSFKSAADIADEQVTTGDGNTEPRYTVNGSFKLQVQPLDILQSVANAGAGFLAYTQGVWSMVPGKYSSPVLTLDESDLIGGLSFQSGPGKQSRHNIATGTYVDPNQNYEAVGFPELRIDEYITQDGEPLEKSFELPFTNSPTMARRIAKINIERNRFGSVVNATFKFGALRLEPGDRINLNNDRLGWSNKVFRVESTEFSLGAGVGLTLREDDPSIYNWTEDDVLALDTPPVLSIPGGLEVSAPTTVNVTDELYSTITRSAVKTRMLVDWTDAESAVAFDVQWKEAADNAWNDAATFWQDNSIEIRDVDDVLHDIRVRSINSLGQRSAWNTVQYDVIGKSAPPPDVPTLFVEKRILKWQLPNAPLDLAGYLVRFHNRDRQTWVDATPAHEGVVTETRFEVDEFAGTKTFLVKAIDTTGNVSNKPAVLVAGLGDPLVENVIDEQTEAPTWTGGEQETYDFSVVSGGVKQPFNVTYQGTDERFQVQSSASYIGAFVNSNDHLEALEIGGFYADSTDLFYSQDPATKFYSSEYERVEYTWTYEVLAADEGADLTVTATINDADNDSIDYIPPGLSSFIAFPGSVEAEVGVYTFKLTIPAQQSTAPPIVEQVFTRLDVGDVEERLGDVAISAGGTRLPIQKTYREIVTVNLTLQDDGGTAETARVIDKDETSGPLVKAYDSSGAETGATIDAIVQGF